MMICNNYDVVLKVVALQTYSASRGSRGSRVTFTAFSAIRALCSSRSWGAIGSWNTVISTRARGTLLTLLADK